MGSHDLDTILHRLDAAELIGEHVALRQTGKTLKGLCPFHSERTPSFHVNPERGLWHCFGCGAGGNLVSFIMKINNLSYQEARDWLARKAGVDLQYAKSSGNTHRDRWYKILEIAASYYHQILLKSEPGEEGLKYLEKRGIHASTIEKFRLGLAPVASQALLKYLSQKNYETHELQEIGLVTKTTPPRDYFFKRILFPIWDFSGAVIGFGGRIFQGEDGPKYLNSPDTPLFKKRETVYALNLAKPAIINKGYSILTEGYMDVLALHQFDFCQAVATLGTSLTSTQAKLLVRQAPKILFCYDGDEAGIEAMQRAFSLTENIDVDLAFVKLPPEEDPDSVLKNEGKEKFQQLLNTSLSPFDFFLERTRTKQDENSSLGKRKIIQEILPLIRRIRDPILKDTCINKLARELHITDSTIRNLLSQKISLTPVITNDLKQEASKPSCEREILSWLLWEPSVAEKVWLVLSPPDFDSDTSKELANLLYRSWQEEKGTPTNFDGISEEALSLLSELSTRQPVGSLNALDELVMIQRDRNVKKEIEKLKREVSMRLKEGKVDTTDEAYRKYLTLLKQIKG